MPSFALVPSEMPAEVTAAQITLTLADGTTARIDVPPAGWRLWSGDAPVVLPGDLAEDLPVGWPPPARWWGFLWCPASGPPGGTAFRLTHSQAGEVGHETVR